MYYGPYWTSNAAFSTQNPIQNTPKHLTKPLIIDAIIFHVRFNCCRKNIEHHWCRESKPYDSVTFNQQFVNKMHILFLWIFALFHFYYCRSHSFPLSCSIARYLCLYLHFSLVNFMFITLKICSIPDPKWLGLVTIVYEWVRCDSKFSCMMNFLRWTLLKSPSQP